MSTYEKITKNPKTNEFETALWIDDFFGKHRYGVEFKDGSIINPENVELETKEEQTDGYFFNDYKKFITKDSGKRKQWESGMQRDTQDDKPRFDLVWQPMLKRWAELMARGAKKYKENNWMLADSEEELIRFKASAYRHLFQWFNDENTEEDHAAACLFNISGAEYLKEKLNAKKKKN